MRTSLVTISRFDENDSSTVVLFRQSWLTRDRSSNSKVHCEIEFSFRIPRVSLSVGVPSLRGGMVQLHLHLYLYLYLARVTHRAKVNK